TAGKRGHRISRAKQLSTASRLKIASAAWQVRSRLRAGLLDWLGARQREKLLQQQLALHQSIVSRLEERVRAGAISSSEIGVARIALAKTRADSTDARRVQAEARAHVAEAIAVPLGALEGLEPSR